MSDTNFKRLDELEVIEEAGESTYAVVEENGVPKRIPGKKIGGLPEGGAPYQQLVTDGEGVAKWEDRTHYEAHETVNEPLNITWDGDTTGKVVALGEFYKLSDLVLTDEQIASVTITYSETGNSISASEAYQKITNEISLVGTEGGVVFVNADNAMAGEYIFPEAGIYFAKGGTGVYIASLTTTEPVEQLKTVIKTLDPKYLPAGTGIKTAIIKSSDYDNALAGVQTALDDAVPEITYSCINMTFAEAWETLMKGDALNVKFLVLNDGLSPVIQNIEVIILVIAENKIACLGMKTFEWTADGITAVD